VTRRIAIAILLTTWSALIVIGVGIYLATRHTLLTDLDESILARAVLLSGSINGSEKSAAASVPDGDRYIIRNSVGRTLARPTGSAEATAPVVVNRAFTTLADGGRLRTIVLNITSASTTQPSSTTTITYSASADRFDRLLNQLLLSLISVGAIAGIGASAAAVMLSRITLRPLRKTAQLIGEIDERRLDRRIDVTELPMELGPMAERLNEMLARLEHAFDERKRFLADASHELRTPVAALMTTMEVALRRPRDVAEMHEILQTCLSDAKSLRHLVDRLMQQVRSESPVANEAPQRFDVVKLIDECIDSLIRAKGSKHIEMRRHLPPSLVLETGQGRLRSILSNLLSNAIEYTPAGGWVEVRCEVADEVMISVADSGPGISAELLPRLFEPFFRGNQQRSLAEGHLGLGLSIVQAHARGLGGRCEVTSGSTGSTFKVVLPTELMVPMAEEMVPK